MGKDIRRHERVQFPGTVQLSWQDGQGVTKFGRGKCVDISNSGMCLNLPVPIPARTYVTLRADKMGVACSASVRHCTRNAGRYIIGIEFSSPIDLADPTTSAKISS